MKHIHTFENFLNEGNISQYKSTVVDALKQLGFFLYLIPTPEEALSFKKPKKK